MTAHAVLSTESAQRVALVIGADTHSRVLDHTDARTCVLFGDGAGAVVLGRRDTTAGVLCSVLSAHGGVASVPITLDDAVHGGRVKENDNLLLIAFSGGMTWGAVALRWAAREPAQVVLDNAAAPSPVEPPKSA